MPYLADRQPAPAPSRFALLALGKLGGREISYHSDLDLILVYEGDGRTGPFPGISQTDFELTDNFHFFTELARSIIKVAGVIGPKGRLYQIDMRLRPTGRSGSLVIPLDEFERYYSRGGAQLWERQALTRARVVYGDADFARQVAQAVENAAYRLPWHPELADEIVNMRTRLEESGSERDLKRSAGGIIDIEFLTQMFRLKYGRTRPEVRHPNTLLALDALRAAGLLAETEYDALFSSFDFLRLVESRLRLVQNRSLDELPERAEDVEKLARCLAFEPGFGVSAGRRLLEALDHHTRRTRSIFLRLLERERVAEPKA
jgi:glutamate-ammonia-ligase adenylyltransferase